MSQELQSYYQCVIKKAINKANSPNISHLVGTLRFARPTKE